MTRLRSVPATRQVVVDGRGIVVTSIFTKTRDSGPWTVAPLPLPDGLEPGDVTFHAARATEWSTDVLVELMSSGAMEVWRLSPQRVRARIQVPKVDTPSAKGEVEATSTGFRYKHLSNQRTTISVTDVPFDVEVSNEYWSAGFEFDLFVSYRSTRVDVARELVELLRQAGLRVWFDKDHLKVGNFDERIRRGVACSDSFVVLWSEGSGTDRGSETGTGAEMSQAEEIGTIIDVLNSRSVSSFGDDCIAIYSVDGKVPDKRLVMGKYQVTWARDHSIKEFGAWVIDWYRGRAKAGYR
jgi:hypothetical protein